MFCNAVALLRLLKAFSASTSKMPSVRSSSKCGKMDTDEHLFTCWGFVDITANGADEVDHNMFYKLDAPLEELVKGAGVLQSIFERLSLAQDDKDMLAG